MTAFDVMVCGSLHLDIVVRAHVLPRIDETAVGSSWKQVCGGKGGNQALQAARAGARSAMIGRIGQDDFGQTLLANLKKAGVDVSGVTIDTVNGSGISVAIQQDNGEYGAVIVSSANTKLDPAWLQNQWSTLGGAKVLILQNEIPHEVNVAAAKAARGSGTSVIVNAAPARDNCDDLLDYVDVLVVNRVEAEAMCGRPVVVRASARTAMLNLRSPSRSAIITLGGDGLIVALKTSDIVEIAPVPVRVSSTHGAGDCFVGVLAAQLASGASLVEACQAANERAAAFVSGIQ